MRDKSVTSLCHISHFIATSSEIGPSNLACSWHRSCRIRFRTSVTGHTIPSGPNSEFYHWSIPTSGDLLVLYTGRSGLAKSSCWRPWLHFSGGSVSRMDLQMQVNFVLCCWTTSSFCYHRNLRRSPSFCSSRSWKNIPLLSGKCYCCIFWFYTRF